MTIAEVLTQRGVEIGIEIGAEKATGIGFENSLRDGVTKGIEQVASNMLKNGVDIAFISQFTGLSPEFIAKLVDQEDP